MSAGISISDTVEITTRCRNCKLVEEFTSDNLTVTTEDIWDQECNKCNSHLHDILEIKSYAPEKKIKEVSDEDIFSKIKEAMRTHADGIVTEVMYDVKIQDVYIATRASTSSYERDDDGYCPHVILTLQSYTGVFEICAMVNYDLQYARDEKTEEYKKDNDKFDQKCLEEAIEYDETEWDIYQEIIESIQEARSDFLLEAVI